MRPPAFCFQLRPIPVGERKRRPVIDGRQAAPGLRLALHLQLFRRFITGIEQPFRLQFFRRLVIFGHAVRLAVEDVMDEAEPAQIFHDAMRIFFR